MRHLGKSLLTSLLGGIHLEPLTIQPVALICLELKKAKRRTNVAN